MLHSTLKHFKQIKITDHALARAKQRLVINDVDVNTLLFESKLKEILKKSQLNHTEGKDCHYLLVYNNQKYDIIGWAEVDQSFTIKTIIPKG